MNPTVNMNRRELIITIEFLKSNLDSLIIVEYVCNKYGLKLDPNLTLGMAGQNVIDYLMQFTSYIDPNEVLGGQQMIQQNSPAGTQKIKIETQADFNVSKYTGKWYNASRIPQPFDRNTPWETAEYKILKPRLIEVKNTSYNENNSIKGQIVGTAEILDPNNMALLYVSFPTGQPRQENPKANYIIHKTDYKRYSIVGSYNGSNLYFLVRDRPIKRDLYEAMIKYAQSLGYDTNKLQEDYGAIVE